MLKRNAKSKILSLCIFAAMLLFVIGILYFGYLMVMRAQWKGLKNDIADAINAASRSNPTFSIGDEALALLTRRMSCISANSSPIRTCFR